MKKTTRNLALSTLAVHMLCAQTAIAMQVLDDHDLRQVEAQDGLAMDIAFDEVNIDRVYWQDNTGLPGATAPWQTLQASANDVKIRHNPEYNSGNYDLGFSAQIQAGADATNKAGISLDLTVRPLTFSTNDFCVHVKANSCSASIGNLAIQTGSDTQIKLLTKDGLFNKNSQSELLLGLENINIYTGLKQNATSVDNIYNQLILKNTNFNFSAKGVAYLDDVNGFVMHTNTGFNPGQKVAYGTGQNPGDTYGYVDLKRTPLPAAQQVGIQTATYQENSGTPNATATSSGLNLEFMLKKNANLANVNTPEYSLTDAKGLIRIGASGRVVNSYLQVRGVNTTNTVAPSYSFNPTTSQGTNNLNNILGYATQNNSTAVTNNNSIIGDTGISLRLYTEFTKEGDTMLAGGGKATTLEIGGAGTNTFGFEFSELHPLIHNSKQRAYFDSGNVYINLANTQHLAMPVNTVLTNLSRFGGTTASTFLTSENDYRQQIHGQPVNAANPQSVVVAIRGMDFQAVSHRGRFTSSIGLDSQNTSYPLSGGQSNTWGLGLPFYNLNSNIALYPTTYSGSIFRPSSLQPSGIEILPITIPSQRLGFALALSVEGKDTAGTKSTSIMVLDAANKYYLGLRNIDMYLRGYGSIGFEEAQFNVDLPDLLMVMAAEIAAGRLPSYVNPNLTVSNDLNNPTNILNAFNSKSDILLGLKIKLLGDMNFSLLPHNSVADGNQLSIIGRYNLKEGTVQVSDPIDDSMIGLDNMEGIIDFNNAIVVGQNNVAFNYGFTFNPNKQADQAFRIKNVNLYPKMDVANPPLGQRIGEMVITGGRMNMNLGITPRNGAFQ